MLYLPLYLFNPGSAFKDLEILRPKNHSLHSPPPHILPFQQHNGRKCIATSTPHFSRPNVTLTPFNERYFIWILYNFPTKKGE